MVTENQDRYRIAVPIISAEAQRMGREALLGAVKEMGARRVFLSVGEYRMEAGARKREMEALRENCVYFKSHGLETGVWIWTFHIDGRNGFMPVRGLEGKVSEEWVCPLDRDFRNFAGEYLMELAECGPDIIMFDDDYRYGWTDVGMGCICENHLRLMEESLGEKITAEGLGKKILTKEKNRYRSAWLKANGDSLRLFAEEMRGYVDRVDRNIRLGVCACMSLWDNDGVDAAAISRILAGETRPFVRLIGAPYWAVEKHWGNRLQNIIELARMERCWCDDDIEVFAEGDVFPRPRTNCPASYLELFDLAMRADGRLDGILKYALDYDSNAGYETGYVERHCRNRHLYEEVRRHFSGKTACGVRVYEAMNKLEEMEIPAEKEGDSTVQDVFFSIAARMLADNAIPSVYTGAGICGISFGENVKDVQEEAMRDGLIIDARAAEILESRGIDTGIRSRGKKVDIYREYYVESDEYTALSCRACELEVDRAAQITSWLIKKGGEPAEQRIIGSYLYENERGFKFLVFAFDAYFNGEGIYRSYARSALLKAAIESFRGRRLPAYSYGNPDLYIMAKQGKGEMAVGLWNMFADSIIAPVIELDGKYTRLCCIQCSGRLEGDRVYLSEIPPFGFAGFTVS